jgi:hypothetical protein
VISRRTNIENGHADVECEAVKRGREQTPFEIHVISMDAFQPDGIRRLEDKGVTDVIVGFRNVYTSGPDTQSLDEKRDALRRFADTVIAKA